jgi:hypothetical protein
MMKYVVSCQSPADRQVMLNGTELDLVSNGDWISTAIALVKVPSCAHVDSRTVSVLLVGSPSRKDRVRHWRSTTAPLSDTHR